MSSDLPQGIASPARPYSCPSCARRYVVVGGRAEPPHCVCGAPLTAIALATGIYEVRRSRRATRRRPARSVAGAAPPGSTTAAREGEREGDQGYGPSHGYGPAHGGPTGPGDAPATEGTDLDEPADGERPGPSELGGAV